MADIEDQWFAEVARNGNFRTMQVWDGDGNPNRVFEINFEGGYINKADVKAFMVETLTQYRTDLGVVFTNGNTVTLSQAVPAGTHKVTIYRDTPKGKPLAAFVDGAIINASNLDRNAKQAVFSVAEMVDRFDSVVEDATDALRTAYNALGLSQQAINVADAAKAQSVVAETKAQAAVDTANTADSKVDGAVSTANAAKVTAEGIDGKATQAQTDAAAAVVTANAAKDTANAIDGKAQTALDKSTAAETKADSAVATANAVDAKATQALANAATANQNAANAVTTAAAALQKSQNLADLVNKATARTNLDVYSRAEVDARNSSYLGEVSWHPSRTRTPGGTVPGDGQRIGNARGLYPEFINRIIAGDFPTTTETSWQANPALRAAYVYDAIANTLRFPDYNGVQPGSYAAPVLRGDGTFAPGVVQKGGVPNVAGRIAGWTDRTGAIWSTTQLTAPFKILPRGDGGFPVYGYGVADTGSSAQDRQLGFDMSLSSDAYVPGLTEVRGNSITGVYVVRVAFVAGNSGTVDMLQLQADLELLKAQTTALNSSIGYTLLPQGTTGLNQRQVLVNPFGINTPVICIVEIKVGNVWQTPGWVFNPSVGSFGVAAAGLQGEGIIVQSGSYRLSALPQSGGGSGGTGGSQDLTSAPFRVHVFSVGTEISKLKQISQIDPALIAEFKAPLNPTGLRQVWAVNGAETGLAGTDVTFSENVKGKRLYLVPNPREWCISCDVPAVFPPNMASSVVNTPAGYFTVFATTDVHGYKLAFNPGGTNAKLTAITGSGAGYLHSIYVDDYTPL